MVSEQGNFLLECAYFQYGISKLYAERGKKNDQKVSFFAIG